MPVAATAVHARVTPGVLCCTVQSRADCSHYACSNDVGGSGVLVPLCTARVTAYYAVVVQRNEPLPGTVAMPQARCSHAGHTSKNGCIRGSEPQTLLKAKGCGSRTNRAGGHCTADMLSCAMWVAALTHFAGRASRQARDPHACGSGTGCSAGSWQLAAVTTPSLSTLPNYT